MMACRSCSQEVPDSADYCPHCGTEMSEYNRISIDEEDTESD